jgi:hypothetical protein
MPQDQLVAIIYDSAPYKLPLSSSPSGIIIMLRAAQSKVDAEYTWRR